MAIFILIFSPPSPLTRVHFVYSSLFSSTLPLRVLTARSSESMYDGEIPTKPIWLLIATKPLDLVSLTIALLDSDIPVYADDMSSHDPIHISCLISVSNIRVDHAPAHLNSMKISKCMSIPYPVRISNTDDAVPTSPSDLRLMSITYIIVLFTLTNLVLTFILNHVVLE